jgi:hypothetical protein
MRWLQDQDSLLKLHTRDQYPDPISIMIYNVSETKTQVSLTTQELVKHLSLFISQYIK